MAKKSHGAGDRSMLPFLSPNIVQNYLNYFSWRKNSNRGAEYSAFFVAKYISKLFELCFMAKKSHGAGEQSIVPFLLPNIFQNYLNYVS
jgi:hypothetical protein